MKYNSRLTALLLAALMFVLSASTAFAATSLSDMTENVVSAAEAEAETNAANYYAELKELAAPAAIYNQLYSLYSSDKTTYQAYLDAHDYVVANNGEKQLICSICVGTLVSSYVYTWPASNICLYEQLAALSESAAYEFMASLIDGSSEGDKLWLAYANIDIDHYYVDATKYPHTICYDGCKGYAQRNLAQPGAENHDSTCPWSKEEYTPQLPAVTPSPDISTPEALKNVTTVTLTAPATGTYVWQKSVYPVSDTSWVAMDGETSSTLVLEIKAETIQYAYRCIITTTADDGTVTTTTTAPFFLGGEEFLAWIYTATGVLNWLKNDTSMEYIIVAYENYLLGIALSEVIYLTNGTLIELEGGTTLALLDENNQLIDVRYKLAVAQVVDGAIVPLN